MGGPSQSSEVRRYRIPFLLTALVVVALMPIVWFSLQPGVLSRGGGNRCDGEVPVWYPGDGGCTRVPSLAEHLWPPERWGAPTYCQGMCLGDTDDEFAEQRRVRDEWREAHAGAVAQ